MGLKWYQIAPKVYPKIDQKIVTFWIVFKSIFERFGGPSWPPIGETNLSILEIFSILEPSWAQEPPKTPPRGPQDPQDPSKRPLGNDF